MEIVLTALTLDAPGGMQTYLLTVAPQLERLGHQVTLFAPEQGTMAGVARTRGLRVAAREEDLPSTCDAVIAQDGITALAMAGRYPGAVRVIVVHSSEYDVHLPPAFDGSVSCAVVLNGAVERRMRALSSPPAIERLRQPIDTDRHQAVGTLSDRPRRVLMLGNYLNGADRDALARVCEESGIAWRQVGAHGDLLPDPLGAISDADIVIGQGRSILDAMACGRAAWVYGPAAGDGWVTPASYAALEADGFRGRATDDVLDAQSFARGLADYRPAMGRENRNLITLHHSAYEHANDLVRLLGALPAGRRVEGPLDELARVVRAQYDAQSGMEALSRELRAARNQLEATRTALASTAEERDTARRDLDGAVRDGASLRAENARLRDEIDDLVGSRRWAMVSSVLSPLDNARRRRQQP